MLRSWIVQPFLHDRRGVTAIEYALIAAFITAAIIAAVPAIGLHLSGAINGVQPGF